MSLRDAAKALVDKLTRVHASREYETVWYTAHLHNGPYQGPTYIDELDALRAALAADAALAAERGEGGEREGRALTEALACIDRCVWWLRDAHWPHLAASVADEAEKIRALTAPAPEPVEEPEPDCGTAGCMLPLGHTGEHLDDPTPAPSSSPRAPLETKP